MRLRDAYLPASPAQLRRSQQTRKTLRSGWVAKVLAGRFFIGWSLGLVDHFWPMKFGLKVALWKLN